MKDDRAEKVGQPLTATTDSNAQLVQQVIQQRHRVSIRRVVGAVEIWPTSTYRLIRYDVVQRIDVGDIHVGSIWFTDEAYFYLDGFVNKQTWGQIWGTENTHVGVPLSLHPQKVMVWADISSKELIGLFFKS